jgi:hypothetical protein
MRFKQQFLGGVRYEQQRGLGGEMVLKQQPSTPSRVGKYHEGFSRALPVTKVVSGFGVRTVLYRGNACMHGQVFEQLLVNNCM